jgi:hypothetical protein
VKINGGYHLLGSLEMMQHNNIEQALFPCEHLYKNWLRSCCLVFTPRSLDSCLGAVAMICRTGQT